MALIVSACERKSESKEATALPPTPAPPATTTAAVATTTTTTTRATTEAAPAATIPTSLPATTQSASTEPSTAPATTRAAEEQPKPIDLLASLKLPDAIVAGEWSMQDGVLVCNGKPGKQRARLRLAAAPTSEYDLAIKFTCSGDKPYFAQILTFNNRTFIWTMTSSQSGFGMINGKNTRSNATTVKKTIGADTAYTSIVKVRKDCVAAYLNDELISQHKTDYSDMSLWEEWKIGADNPLGLVIQCSARITSATLTPIGSEAPTVTPPAPLTYPDLAALIADSRPGAQQPATAQLERFVAATQPALANAAAMLKESPKTRLAVWDQLTAHMTEFYPDAKEQSAVVKLDAAAPSSFAAVNTSGQSLSDVTLAVELTHFDSVPLPTARRFYFIGDWPAGGKVELPATITPNLESAELAEHQRLIGNLHVTVQSDPWLSGAGGVVSAKVTLWSNQLRQPSQQVEFDDHRRAAARSELGLAYMSIDDLLRHPPRTSDSYRTAIAPPVRVLVPPKVSLPDTFPVIRDAVAIAKHVLANVPETNSEATDARALIADPQEATRQFRKRQLDEFLAALPPVRSRSGVWTVRAPGEAATTDPDRIDLAANSSTAGHMTLTIDSRPLTGDEITATLTNPDVAGVRQTFTGRLQIDSSSPRMLLVLRTAQSAAATQRARTDAELKLPTSWFTLTLEPRGDRLIGSAEAGGSHLCNLDVIFDPPLPKK